jgi:hypothetical protein
MGPEHRPPVFVDPSGLRRRRVRWLSYLLVAVVVVVVLALWMSQLGGSVRPPSTVPCTTAHTGSPAPNGTVCDR